jgi:hypothetical protein
MLKKTLVALGILAALLAGAWLMLLSRREDGHTGVYRPDPAQIRGEPIKAMPPAAPALAVATPTNSPQRRKRPKPPSVQRRMVLARLSLSDNPNMDDMPAGTAGTAADLMRTNLTAAELFGIQEHLPDYSELSFRTLAGFEFGLTKDIAGTDVLPAQAMAKAKEQIPQTIWALDGTKVVIQGFLLPVRMDDSLAVEFLLLRTQSMCCYGVPPKINEWISVHMTGTGVKAIMDRPIVVAGTLHVGPSQEHGLLAGIYTLDGDRVLGPF